MGLLFFGKSLESGKVKKLENGKEKSGICFKNQGKIGKSQDICVVLKNCSNIYCNSVVAFFLTLLIFCFGQLGFR